MSKKISELTAASALTGAELVEVVQGGTNKRTTAQGIADLGAGSQNIESVLTAGNDANSLGIQNLVFRSEDHLSNANIFETQQRQSGIGDITTINYDVDLVKSGPNNSTYLVTAKVVVMDNNGTTGGATIIAGVFKKDGSAAITQIGTTQTIVAAQEDISGSLVVSFSITGAGSDDLNCVVATAGVGCNSMCVLDVTCITNQAS